MRLKKFALISALVFSTLPLFAYADVTVVNNTDSYATASIGSSPCSSSEGDNGIVKPHSSLTIPQVVFTMYCGLSTSCGGHVYMTKDCGNSGSAAATVTVDAIKGDVTGYTNLDKDHFKFSGGGKHVAIDPVHGLKSLFNLLF